MTETRPLLRLRIGRLVLCLTAVGLFLFPPSASAVILMEVLNPLMLFEVAGLSFTSYSTSGRARLQILDTDTERSAIVNVLGQHELRSQLTLIAVSHVDPDQKVRIEVDVAPLRDPEARLFVLDAFGTAVEPEPVTDPLLTALLGPLRFGLELEVRTGHADPLRRLAIYRLRSVERGERSIHFLVL
ncbi:MAG TPA: hypothetical protein VFF31_14505 [Blastocatellia bacterium]|nr:hypothetical protein [Blastocatellia bacterium]